MNRLCFSFVFLAACESGQLCPGETEVPCANGATVCFACATPIGEAYYVCDDGSKFGPSTDLVADAQRLVAHCE